MAIAEGRVQVVSVIGDPLTIVSLDEAKNYIRVTVDAEDDALITSQISAAIEVAEAYLSRDILSKRIQQTEVISRTGDVCLYRAPIAAVTGVEVDNETLTIGTGYELIGATDNPTVRLSQAINFADDVPEGPYRNIVIDYTTAGLNNAVIKQGVLSVILGMYDAEMSDNYMSILAPYKILYV